MSNCTKQGDTLECAVCLQTCVHPAQLPCGHIFCYLCVKGFANQNKRCAMCRQEIPRDFIEQPRLLNPCSCVESGEGFDGDFRWYYEGRNGWWLYDERTSKELELSYKKGEKNIEILIAGFLYIIDFENMLQLRRNDPSRRRQIKRDHASQPVKGVAGLRADPPLQPSSNPEPSSNSCPHMEGELSTPTSTNSHNATSGSNLQGTVSNVPSGSNGSSTYQTPQCNHILLTGRDRFASLRVNSSTGGQNRSNNQESSGTSESNVARFLVEHMGSLRLEDNDLTVTESSGHSDI